jgi:biopolymer transport protein ExbB
MIRWSSLVALVIAVCLIMPVAAQEAAPTPAPAPPKSLAELLEQVKAGNAAEQAEFARREAEFKAARSQQEGLLRAALAAKAAEEARGQRLEQRFDANEKRIPELQETLRTRMGTLGELFGVVRQVAGDTRAQLDASLVSAQLPGRSAQLAGLMDSREMPSMSELEQLWYLLQQEMTESGRVVRFTAPVIAAAGGESAQPVVRIGPFSAVAGGRYLQWVQESGKLTELGRQPAGSHLGGLSEFEAAREGMVGVSIDPTRGSLMSLLIETPDLRERLDQGGAVGYTIVVLAIVGFLITLYRLAYLFAVGRRVQAQLASPAARADNPLGRVLAVYDANRAADTETLELKLDEAIMKEVPPLESGQSFIKVLSVIGPLLGLLGTVTGMIKTFQVITLFGAGDPKLMAGGIAEALVTTVLGLVMAVPLTLGYAFVQSRSKRLIEIVEEQAAGIVAEHAEERAAARGTTRAVAG